MHLGAFPREIRLLTGPVSLCDTTGAGPASALRLGTSPGLSDWLRYPEERNNSDRERNKINYQRAGLGGCAPGAAHPGPECAPRAAAHAGTARGAGRAGGWRTRISGEKHRRGKKPNQPKNQSGGRPSHPKPRGKIECSPQKGARPPPPGAPSPRGPV